MLCSNYVLNALLKSFAGNLLKSVHCKPPTLHGSIKKFHCSIAQKYLYLVGFTKLARRNSGCQKKFLIVWDHKKRWCWVFWWYWTLGCVCLFALMGVSLTSLGQWKENKGLLSCWLHHQEAPGSWNENASKYRNRYIPREKIGQTTN